MEGMKRNKHILPRQETPRGEANTASGSHGTSLAVHVAYRLIKGERSKIPVFFVTD